MPHSYFFTISAALLGKMFACLKVKRHEDNQTFFTKNGAALLEELIAFCNGRSNPIRHFSTNELLTATNYYDANQMFLQSGFYKLYKGSLNYRPIFVKKYHNYRIWRGVAAKDIAVGSQMSVHKNVLKVLGCCLETETPIIVYEFAGTESLSTCISATNVEPLPWKCRLKIAVGIANAVAYLHTAFSRPVIHRSIHCSSLVLDQNNVPKLIDFGLCISIPEGQSHVKDAIRGRAEWVSPEYWDRGHLTEKADVYLFGKLLIELLTGQQAVHFMMEHDITDIGKVSAEKLSNSVDSRIKNEGIDQEQLLDFATLSLRCISFEEEKRPTMIEVGKELRQIDQACPLPC
ncbi:Kinase superfamily protein, putative [Theobroma cacao]|uniref:Kinase superfamily protein, putative n=1 Tax=Theobroma cacao TaxID=3641 RepID=A0A061F425_THECC|nr:Kinase superfamily protein, putative [Theobroma cacao]